MERQDVDRRRLGLEFSAERLAFSAKHVHPCAEVIGVSDGISRSWAKANNPYWSDHVETWYRGHQEAEEYCRRRKLSCATFEQWARHLVSPEDLVSVRNVCRNCAGKRQMAARRAIRSGAEGLRAIATVCARTAVRSLFERSGACMSKL